MSAYELKNNTGCVFSADKGNNAKRPDFTGAALLNGVKGELALWLRTTSKGKPMVSFKFTPESERRPSPPTPARDNFGF